MNITTRNDVINVKPYLGCCVWILMIFILIRKIDKWAVSTVSQYTFPVWQFMNRLRICTNVSSLPYHMIWHKYDAHVASLYFYMIHICDLIFTRPSVLSILALIFEFFKYQSRQDSKNAWILLAEIKIHINTLPCIVLKFVLILVATMYVI